MKRYRHTEGESRENCRRVRHKKKIRRRYEEDEKVRRR
jgi:hypothetical protein